MLRNMHVRLRSAGRNLSRGIDRPWVSTLVALAVSAMVWSAVAPASMPRLPGRAPVELPARLDDGFLDDLPGVAANLPPESLVEIVVPKQRRQASSWYWTMAAFTHPELIWERAPAGGDGRATLRIVAATDQVLAPGWTRVACGREWCLWRR